MRYGSPVESELALVAVSASVGAFLCVPAHGTRSGSGDPGSAWEKDTCLKSEAAKRSDPEKKLFGLPFRVAFVRCFGICLRQAG